MKVYVCESGNLYDGLNLIKIVTTFELAHKWLDDEWKALSKELGKDVPPIKTTDDECFEFMTKNDGWMIFPVEVETE